MLLAIDTSGKSGGIALARYDGEFAVICAEADIAGGTFSAELVPQIAALLQQAGARLPDVSAIACITGPGSFTGLRIGLAAVKGLCETHPVPAIPVTMLELLASSVQAENVTTVLDAGRREIYVGEYRVAEGIPGVVSETLQTVVASSLQGLVLSPDAAVTSALGAVEVPRPRPADLAHYAVKKLARGMTTTADALDAHYIRRSDAELFSKPLFHSANESKS